MQWNLKKMLITVSVLAMLWVPTTQAQEAGEPLEQHLQAYTQTLRWRNGNVLPGQLLESTVGIIRWVSPYFSDDLVVDMSVLDSVIFSEQSTPATEAFRIETVSGDIWMADIIDSGDNTFLFSSKRHGRFRVNRATIYILERWVHSNFIFDGSQLTAWELPKRRKNDPMVLRGRNAQLDWYADRVGHPRTDKVKSKIFHALDLPERFEIDLELASDTRPPGFVFALGKNLYETVRLETWVNELVVVQGTLFEPVLTIQPDQRSFRLRLAYDGDADVLEVLDFAGNLLLKLDGVEQTVVEPGLYVYNRGQDLTVRQLRVYRRPTNPAKQPVDPSKPRIHLMDGRVVYGKLFVEKDSAYVRDADEVRRDIDLQQIDRIVQPGAALTETDYPVALTYPDGAVFHGKIDRVSEDGVVLQTDFADEPITCAFTGASLLRIKPDHSWVPKQVEDGDKLFHPFGNLRGKVLFDGQDESLIRWKPVGALEPVRLASTRAVRIERNNRRTSKVWPHNTAQFRHILHLRNGENIPCQISAYDGTTVNFQSPFINAEHIGSVHVKAFEFSDRTHAKGIGSTRGRQRNATQVPRFLKDGEIEFLDPKVQKVEIITKVAIIPRRVEVNPGGEKNEPKVRRVVIHRDGEDGNKVVIDGDNIGELKPDNVLILKDLPELREWIEIVPSHQEPGHGKLDMKLERALTVPRFSRDNPPSHILVAENGDMKRGKLISFNGQSLQFDSKFRRFSVPIDRVRRVVEVSVDSSQQSVIGRQKVSQPSESEVGVKLTDSSILVFEPLEVRDGELLGRSSIYGEITVPVGSIEHLYFGDTAASLRTAFEAWVVRPAKESVFGENP